jgi:thiopeptide-type bacteriocin biosynthesis protein
MAEAGDRERFRPSGLFVMRTPLLPFEELEAWGEALAAPHALADGEDGGGLEAALAADRALLQDRLRGAWVRPEVREAVFLASPDLCEALDRWAGEDGDGGDNAKAVRSFVAYLARMAGRATPFGLFSGCSTGAVGRQTRLALAGRETYRRHTRPDMDYLSALVEALERDPGVRDTLRYAPNSSLYRAGGRLRYAESRLDKTGRSYHLVALDATDYLQVTLERAEAAGGAGLGDLAAALVDGNVGAGEAREFVDELVGSQVLVSDLGPDVTGAEAIHGLIARLSEQAETRPVAQYLAGVRDDLERIDAAGVGGSDPARYAAIRATLEQLPARPEPARLFQVDLTKPGAGLSLGAAVLAEIERGVDLLRRLARPEGRGPLRTFRERFLERYEEAEVPLVEALDEEMGIGFEAAAEPGGEPLLEGLEPPPGEPAAGEWLPRDHYLLHKLAQGLRRGDAEVVLEPADIAALETKELAPLPDTLEVFARLAAPSAEAVDRGAFRLWLQGAGGAPGVRLLGRFCHADPELRQGVEAHLRAEEALRPDAVFAEIVHLPEGRVGNILSRPVLRAYEIPFLGQSGAPRDRQVPITDLHVSVRGGRVVLRSARLGCEVLPRLTTAHNFSLRSLGIYRFLCTLQQQGTLGGLGWSWGPLDTAPFLPRVVIGRLVLARACWNVAAAELKPLGEARGAAQFAAVQAWRAERGLPRYVALADFDNELVVDLDNVLSIEAFLHLVKGRDRVRLVELFPPPDALCVRGPEGRFVHELVIPFVKVAAARTPAEPAPATSSAVRRRFPPGSEWLYAKLYTGPATADRVLTETVRPVVEEVARAGLAAGWFFIRYADPDPHLRLRFHGDPRRLAAELLPMLEAAVAPLVEDGRVWRVQLDTYLREVERYGGDAGILLAERLFHLDSECALSVLESVPGDEGLDWRWKLALCGVDLLLDALGLDLAERRDWARGRRSAFAREFRADGRLNRQLGEKYRSERQGLAELRDLAYSEGGLEYPAVRALRRRTEGLAEIAGELRALEQTGRLGTTVPDLAASYAHMHVNRMLRSAHRFQELAVYDLLDRLYLAQSARGGGG